MTGTKNLIAFKDEHSVASSDRPNLDKIFTSVKNCKFWRVRLFGVVDQFTFSN